MKDISRNVAMLCPLCGNDQFSSVDEEFDELKDAPGTAKIKCSDCNSVYTKDEIIEANAEKIDIAAEEMVQGAIKEFEKELKKAMKKWK